VSSTRLPQQAKGERPQYFADPAIDKVLSITLALAGEVAVLRERLDAVERLLEAGKPVTRATLDAYVPDAAARAERDAWREQFLDVILRVVHQEREALARQAAAVAPQPAASQARAAGSSAGTK
jgi:hypothetical protein